MGELNDAWEAAQISLGATLSYVLYISLVKILLQDNDSTIVYVRVIGSSVGILVLLLAPARVSAATEEVTEALLKMQSKYIGDNEIVHDIDLLLNYTRGLDMGCKN